MGPNIGRVGRLLADLLANKMTPKDRTDVDFRPIPQRPDVIGGYESRPHVPGSTNDQVR